MLYGRHHFHLRATPCSQLAEDHQHLGAFGAVTRAALGEEHERSPLALHQTERLTTRAHDKGHALAGHTDHGEIVAALIDVNLYSARALLLDETDVVLGLLALLGRASYGYRVLALVQVEAGPANALDLILGAAVLAEDEGRVVGLTFHDLLTVTGAIVVVVVVVVIVPHHTRVTRESPRYILYIPSRLLTALWHTSRVNILDDQQAGALVECKNVAGEKLCSWIEIHRDRNTASAVAAAAAAARGIPGRGIMKAATWTQHTLPPPAVCLDGSPPVIYVRPPRATASSTFVLFLEGGGWCNSPTDCVSRMQSPHGSSRTFRKETASPGPGAGYWDPPLPHSIGEAFAGATLVFFKYCDGASFAGQAAVTLPPLRTRLSVGSVAGSIGRQITVTWAGRSTLHAALDALFANHGLGAARNVLLSGCSAGGLAALLGAEAVRARLRASGAPLERFKVAVWSGIFPYLPHSAYTQQMRSVFEMANMSISDRCRTRWPGTPWRCILGLEPLEAVPADIPVFLEQSVLDRWHTGCILAAASSAYEVVGCSRGVDSGGSSWEKCLRHMEPLANPRQAHERCSPLQLRTLDAHQQTFMGDLRASHALSRPGYGAFLHGCHSHCPGHLGRYVIDTLSLEAALLDWWRAARDASPLDHVRVGCLNNWSALVERRLQSREHGRGSGGARCRPRCAALYPWPDARAQIRKRLRTVEVAVHGTVPPGLEGP